MALSIKVKNTFVEVKLDRIEESPDHRRCSSVPRAFKPVCNSEKILDDDHSTSASELFECCRTVLSDYDYQDCVLDPSDWSSDNGILQTDISSEDFSSEVSQPSEDDPVANAAKVKLSLDNMVVRGSDEDARSKLRSRAKPFQSVMASLQSVMEPPREVTGLIDSAVEVMQRSKNVLDVQVNEGRMGGTMMIVARCSSLNDASIIPSAKHALLKTASESKRTYVMGYSAKPFNDLDAYSFSAKIGHLPEGHQTTACWDTYANGFCHRGKKCRWSHPAETHTLRIVFVLKAVM